MAASRIPLVGPGHFQWNAGAWFGSWLGSSAWLIVTAGFLLFNRQPLLATVPAIAFCIILIVSVRLWSLRDRIYPFQAMMIVLGFLALAFPAVWIIVQSKAAPSTLTVMNWPDASWTVPVASIIVPLFIIWCVLIERGSMIDRNT